MHSNPGFLYAVLFTDFLGYAIVEILAFFKTSRKFCKKDVPKMY